MSHLFAYIFLFGCYLVGIYMNIDTFGYHFMKKEWREDKRFPYNFQWNKLSNKQRRKLCAISVFSLLVPIAIFFDIIRMEVVDQVHYAKSVSKSDNN